MTSASTRADTGTEPDAQRVGLAPLAAYASPVIGVSFLYMMVTVMYMNFSTDVLGIAPGVVGTLFFLSKIWDAISDPMVGHWSDTTRSRFGRRRSWMLASTVPLAASTVLLWAPPAWLGGTPLVAWVAFSLFAFFTAFTLYSVPQMALGAEMSESPRERARIFGIRQIAYTLGMLLAFVFAAPLLADPETARRSALWMAGIGAALTAFAVLVGTLRLPAERPDYAGRGASSPLRAVRDVLANPHARLLLFVYFIEVFGIGGTSAMTAYMLKYVTMASDFIGIVFLVYTVPAVLFIPFWVWLGGRVERYKVWIFAMGIQAAGYGLMMFQDEGRIALMVVSALLTGFAMGCGATLGQSIKADVIDWDEYETGERKEGAYFATWNLAGKLGTGLMIAFSGWALQLSGFVENADQGDATILTIKLLMGGAPGVCITVGLLAFTRFRLTSAEHERIRGALAERAASKS